MSFFIVQSPYPCRAQRLAYLLFDAVFGFPAYYYEPDSDVGVRTLKRRESFVFESHSFWLPVFSSGEQALQALCFFTLYVGYYVIEYSIFLIVGGRIASSMLGTFCRN